MEAGLALSQLSGSALAWLREYKVQHTSMSLAEMGFPIGACEAASLATGGEVEPALEMLASGQTPPPPGAGEARPVDITRWVAGRTGGLGARRGPPPCGQPGTAILSKHLRCLPRAGIALGVQAGRTPSSSS